MDLSGGTLLASMVVSTIGFGLFMYGKKQLRIPQVIAGVLMMVFPYFVGGAMLISGIGAAMVAGLWIAVRSGL